MIAGRCWPRGPATRRWLNEAQPPPINPRRPRRIRTFDPDQRRGAVSVVRLSTIGNGGTAMLRCGKFLLALAVMIAIPCIAAAQATDGKPPAPEQTLLKPEQLDALVAPIALYPDELLANVLAASTYPLEAVQADRWVKANKNLKNDALKAAVDKQAWDDSVKALASTPDVLAMMSDKIDWTKNLGDAVLAQQPDVMDAIQRLRAKAQVRNKLVTNKQQKVSVQQQENKEVIVIEQAQSDTVYVPYYDPATVYGDWPYAEYPPYYFGYPSPRA
jgi:hypothetical protein